MKFEKTCTQNYVNISGQRNQENLEKLLNSSSFIPSRNKNVDKNQIIKYNHLTFLGTFAIITAIYHLLKLNFLRMDDTLFLTKIVQKHTFFWESVRREVRNSNFL